MIYILCFGLLLPLLSFGQPGEKTNDNSAQEKIEQLDKITEKHFESSTEEDGEKAVMIIYGDFMEQMEPTLLDQTFADSLILANIRAKLAQLEREQALNTQLLKQQRSLNTILVLVIVLALGFLSYMVYSRWTIRRKNKEIALQSLRREMNPHFIFNSLNSINHFISQNKELEANKYLSSYSKLMRRMMENSSRDFIPLSVEIEQMTEYMELERMRFPDKFDYAVEVSPDLDSDTEIIPNMLIQTQLENAVWHGLRYKETKGILSLKVWKENNLVLIQIEDDGIGMTKSRQLKTSRQKEHRSRGLSNTYERIDLLNQLYHTNIHMDIREKRGEESGVVVTLSFPEIRNVQS